MVGTIRINTYLGLKHGVGLFVKMRFNTRILPVLTLDRVIEVPNSRQKIWLPAFFKLLRFIAVMLLI